MVEMAGVSVEEAIRMASLHPARLLGMEDRLGSIGVGKLANLIELNVHLEVQKIWIKGIPLNL